MPDLFGRAYSHYERLVRSAEISECGKYRWWLRRSWQVGGNGKSVNFIMLNPSKADALVDDPTIRRCMGFARDWGYSSLYIVNLFPWRATDPKELLELTYEEATGGERGDRELAAAVTADLVIAAWGASVPRNGKNHGRVQHALELLSGKTLHCLGMTSTGAPRHPLYCRADLQPILFKDGREEAGS